MEVVRIVAPAKSSGDSKGFPGTTEKGWRRSSGQIVRPVIPDDDNCSNICVGRVAGGNSNRQGIVIDQEWRLKGLKGCNPIIFPGA